MDTLDLFLLLLCHYAISLCVRLQWSAGFFLLLVYVIDIICLRKLSKMSTSGTCSTVCLLFEVRRIRAGCVRIVMCLLRHLQHLWILTRLWCQTTVSAHFSRLSVWSSMAYSMETEKIFCCGFSDIACKLRLIEACAVMTFYPMNVSLSLSFPLATIPKWKMWVSRRTSQHINIHKYSVWVPRG